MNATSQSQAATPPRAATGPAPSWRRLLAGNEIILVLIVISVLASLASPTFFTEVNIRNILNQASVLGILACAQFLVVLIGGFDLSVAAVMALASVIFAVLAPTSLPLAALASLVAGTALGTLSGIAVTFGRVPSLIATLGVMGIARGFAFVVAEKSVAVPRDLLLPFKSTLWIFSVPVLVWFVIAVMLAWVLANTRFGRNLYAIGGNERAARLAAVPVRQRQVTVYTLSGFLSALAGLALVVRTSSGVPQIGEGWELDAIAAIVIGGARLFGGEGNILRAMIGVIIYQMIANIMNLVSLDPFYQDIVKATVIVVVVGVSVLRDRRAQGGRP
jgi:ribose/xylose/arabinose/galactoside ABC-type transport system permease subunit